MDPPRGGLGALDLAGHARRRLAFLEAHRLLRFMLVGASGVGVNLAVLYTLTEFAGLYYLASGAVATQTAIVTNFLLNDAFTFHDRRSGLRAGRFARYEVVNLGGLCINVAALFAFTELAGFPYMVSALFAVLCAFSFNYALNFHWTYGRR
ncbi:MAG TPA: GtrA family protein [Candidatus Thermoplasmatota archaeon]|nr:GtrA family protein [Candidatus Thermoplasmatota archaeon]